MQGILKGYDVKEGDGTTPRLHRHCRGRKKGAGVQRQLEGRHYNPIGARDGGVLKAVTTGVGDRHRGTAGKVKSATAETGRRH